MQQHAVHLKGAKQALSTADKRTDDTLPHQFIQQLFSTTNPDESPQQPQQLTIFSGQKFIGLYRWHDARTLLYQMK